MRATHIIEFTEDYPVEWSDLHNGTVKLLYNKGDVTFCNLNPDGPGCEEFNEPVCDIYLPGGIDLWNVPESCFRIIQGEHPEALR